MHLSCDTKAAAKVVCQIFTNSEAGVSWIIVPVKISTDHCPCSNIHRPSALDAKLSFTISQSCKAANKIYEKRQVRGDKGIRDVQIDQTK